MNMVSKMLHIFLTVFFFTFQPILAGNNCVPGYYLPSSATECAACPAGTFQPNSGADGCIPCASGFISTVEASDRCYACNPNETTNTYHTACICEDGYFFDYDTSTRCEICPAGTQYIRAEGYSYCAPCPINTYQPNEGASVCLDCPKGSHSGFKATECITCALNEVLIGGNCGSCPAGSYYYITALDCFQCNPGSFRATAGTDEYCEVCPTGTYSGFGFASCVTCPEGSALMADGSCSTCTAGEYYDLYSLSCRKCSAGSYNPKNQVYTSCFTCGPNRFSFEGSKKFKKCKEGETLLEGGKCRKCPAGTYLDVFDGRTCKQCKANTFNAAGIAETCRNCPRNTYSLAGSGNCTTCPNGQALITASALCDTCPPGEFYDVYSGNCTLCSPGTFKASPGIGECEHCPQGTTHTDGRTACILVS